MIDVRGPNFWAGGDGVCLASYWFAFPGVLNYTSLYTPSPPAQGLGKPHHHLPRGWTHPITTCPEAGHTPSPRQTLHEYLADAHAQGKKKSDFFPLTFILYIFFFFKVLGNQILGVLVVKNIGCFSKGPRFKS